MGKSKNEIKNHKIYEKATEKKFLLPLCEPVDFGLTTTTNIHTKHFKIIKCKI